MNNIIIRSRPGCFWNNVCNKEEGCDTARLHLNALCDPRWRMCNASSTLFASCPNKPNGINLAITDVVTSVAIEETNKQMKISLLAFLCLEGCKNLQTPRLPFRFVLFRHQRWRTRPSPLFSIKARPSWKTKQPDIPFSRPPSRWSLALIS